MIRAAPLPRSDQWEYYHPVMGSLLFCALAGTVLVVVAVWVGWTTAATGSGALVRLIRWWLERVMLPQLGTLSWTHRAAVIATNNLLILAALVALGRWLVPVLIGTALCGVSMGIALRLLPDLASGFDLPPADDEQGSGWRMRVGIILNLLEPPAIILALGLAIGRNAIPLPSAEAWAAFGTWVVPAMLLAAGGEALWLGVLVRAHEAPGRPEPESDEPPEED